MSNQKCQPTNGSQQSVQLSQNSTKSISLKVAMENFILQENFLVLSIPFNNESCLTDYNIILIMAVLCEAWNNVSTFNF